MSIDRDKPLGRKSYGSIGHLPNSRLGSGDWHVHEGQARIACEKPRDKHDRIVVTEKLDGSNVGVAKVNGDIVAIGRAGYTAMSSPYEQHRFFAFWVEREREKFAALLTEGERVCGEWLLLSHGTRYRIDDPARLFVAFDLMAGEKRAPWDDVISRCEASDIGTVRVISDGPPLSAEAAMERLEPAFVAEDELEGAVWRVERKGAFDFMAKWVRPTKQDGKYLKGIGTDADLWNMPLKLFWSYVNSGRAAA